MNGIEFTAAMEILHVPEPAGKIAIAVSGGSDSMALTLLIHGWAKEHHVQLVTLTIDHQLRPESSEEAKQVGQWMTSHGIEHHILTIAVSQHGNLQANARHARYAALCQWCRKHSISHVLLGHHQDDQAETLLLRLGRGSGLKGLCCMRPATAYGGITLLRPLLGIPKSALQDYLHQRKQAWLEDPSNQSGQYRRNRLRKLMPKLEDIGLTRGGLAHTTRQLQKTDAYLDKQLEQAWQQSVTLNPLGYATLDVSGFYQLHPEMQFLCLQRLLMTISGETCPPRSTPLELAIRRLIHPEFSGCTLHGCMLQPVRKAKITGQIQVSRERAALPAPEEIPADATSLFWDQRFLLSFDTLEHLQQPLVIQPISSLSATLRNEATNRLPNTTQNVPKHVLDTLPVITHLESLVALPHIHNDAKEECPPFCLFLSSYQAVKKVS